MKSFQKQLYCLTVSLLVILLSLPAKAHSGYDYTSNSTVADTLGGILNGSIPIFDDGKGYAVGSSIGDGRHDFGGTFGWTCWAYANAVYYKLFGSVPQSSGTNVVNIVGTTSASYDSFLSAGVKCGTYMRTEGNGGHSIIILSYNPSIITWVDANWSSDGVIKIHNESYSYFNTWYINYKGRRLNRVINPSYVIPPTPNNDDTSSINKTYRIKSTTTLGLNIRNVPTTSNNAPIGLLNPGDTIVCTKRTNYQANGYYWLFGTSSTGIPGWITENYEWIEEVSPTPTTAYLDVNGWLDATFSGNLGDCGTVDVYINGELVANDVNDYYTAWPVGTTYEISDIRARQGYIYRGAHISYLSGKIDSSGTDVELSFDRDGILPTISNVAVANITSEGYTVTCTVTDNIGIEKVQFPTWYEGQQGEDAIWHDGIITGNTATCTINVSDHDGKTGLNYHTDVYAWDVAGNRSIGANARYNYVPNPTVRISSISLDKYKLTMDVGTTYALDASVYPVNATNKSLFWATNNSSACVVNDGVIKAEGEGDAIITCAANDGSGVYVECQVSVNPVFANAVMLNRSVYEFSNSSEGGLELTATLSPDNASDKSVTWSSSNTDVATVSNGIVKPVAAGYTRIICEAAGGATGVCDIVVHAGRIKRLPKSLKTIEADTFYGTSLREVIVPEGATSIDSKAFGNCGKLALINIPASVKIIASDAFSGSNVAFVCENTCYATEYADVKGIPYIIGSMPREVVISAEKTTLMPGQSVMLQGSVSPANAPKAIHWSIVEGSDIATISSNGNKCVLSADAAGHVTVAATAINSAKGTIDISIIEHPTNFEIWFDGNGGNASTDHKTAEFDAAVGMMPAATWDYHKFEGWYNQANGGTKVTAETVFSDYFMGDITLYAHWTENQWSEWLESSQVPSGNIVTESKTQYRYSDMYYSDWNYGGWTTERRSITDGELQKEESTTLYGWYYYVCPNCGAHWPRYDGNNYSCNPTYGGCGSTASRKSGEVFFWDPTPHGNYSIVNHGGASRYCTSSNAHSRWYGWYDNGYRTCTGYRYASRTKNWKTWSSWSDAAVASSATRRVETRTVYRYKMK